MVTFADWQARAQKELRDRPLEGLSKTNLEGLDTKPLYTQADTSGLDHLDAHDNLPGFAPFHRPSKRIHRAIPY